MRWWNRCFVAASRPMRRWTAWDMMICTRKAALPFAARRSPTGRKWEHFLLTPEPLSEIICWIAAVRSNLREKNLPLLSLDAFAEMGAPEPVSPFHTEDLISDVSSSTLLSHFKNRYHGTARLGIEAMELRVRGYSCADIAKLYQKKPNYIGACISRAAEKLRRERIVREFYTACTEQDIKSA